MLPPDHRQGRRRVLDDKHFNGQIGAKKKILDSDKNQRYLMTDKDVLK